MWGSKDVEVENGLIHMSNQAVGVEAQDTQNQTKYRKKN